MIIQATGPTGNWSYIPGGLLGFPGSPLMLLWGSLGERSRSLVLPWFYAIIYDQIYRIN